MTKLQMGTPRADRHIMSRTAKHQGGRDDGPGDMPTSKKSKILDAAERLFADRGLKAASLRLIAGEAGVDVSLITYHFRTKAALFGAVIERRTTVFLNEQNRYLEACEEKALPGKPGLEEVVDAFCFGRVAVDG